jgi:cytochrome c553
LKKAPSTLFAGAVALLTAALFALTAAAQAPQAEPPAAGGPPPPHSFPAPTNLKVLPKDFTGQQVHDLMEKWAGSLGAHCSTCHTADPNDIGPNGRPRLKFADDTRPEKATARLMYTMVEQINKDYISKIDVENGPVTCGTCHRGKLAPEPFVIPPDEHGPPPPPPGAAPAAK